MSEESTIDDPSITFSTTHNHRLESAYETAVQTLGVSCYKPQSKPIFCDEDDRSECCSRRKEREAFGTINLSPLPYWPILLTEADPRTCNISNLRRQWGDSVTPVLLKPISTLKLNAIAVKSGRIPTIYGKAEIMRDTEIQDLLKDADGLSNLFWRAYSIPSSLFLNYKLIHFKLIPSSSQLEASVSWRIHQRIRDFYQKHVQVFDKYLKNSTPYQGVQRWQSFFEASHCRKKRQKDATRAANFRTTLSAKNDRSSSCEELFDSASIEVFESLSCDVNDSSPRAEISPTKNRLRVKFDGQAPVQMGSDHSMEFSSIEEDGTHQLDLLNGLIDSKVNIGDLYRKPKPLSKGHSLVHSTHNQLSTLLKYLPGGKKEKKEPLQASQISASQDLQREAWRVWALRRGLRPVLGIYKRPGRREFLLVSGSRSIDTPESEPGVRHELDMLTYIVHSHLLYPQESDKRLGMLYKDLRIKRIAAMLTLVIYSLHQEGIAHGSLNDFSNSIIFQFNDSMRSYYPVLQEFSNTAVASNSEVSNIGSGSTLKSSRSLFTMKASDDWHALAKIILFLFLGVSYYSRVTTAGNAYLMETYEEELMSHGAPTEAVDFVSMLLNHHQVYGAGILVDPWLVEVDWNQIISGIH